MLPPLCTSKAALLLLLVLSLYYGPDVHFFNPARFINERTGELTPGPVGTKEESHVTFGFGRRICPGRHVAVSMLVMQVTMMLWAMDIEGLKDENGLHVEIDTEGCIDDGFVV